MYETISRLRIGKAPTKLGFQKRQVGNLTVYRNSEKDATVVVPENFLGSYGLSMYLNAARETVVGKGITSADTFELLVKKAGQTKHINKSSRTSKSAGNRNVYRQALSDSDVSTSTRNILQPSESNS